MASNFIFSFHPSVKNVFYKRLCFYLKGRAIFVFSISRQLHTGFTPTSPNFCKFISIREHSALADKGGDSMRFLGLEWYWCLVIVAVLAISVPLKIKFVKWWSKREQEKKKEQHGKWGEDE